MLKGANLAAEVELLSDFVPTAREAEQFLLASLVEELSTSVLSELSVADIRNLRRLHQAIGTCLDALEDVPAPVEVKPVARPSVRRAHSASLALIVEDEGLVAFDLKTTFVRTGFDAVAVPSLARAWGTLAQGLPDVAMLDVAVLDGDTFDLARFLIKHDVTVAFVTGMKTLPQDLEGLQRLTKPFCKKDLIRFIEDLPRARARETAVEMR